MSRMIQVRTQSDPSGDARRPERYCTVARVGSQGGQCEIVKRTSRVQGNTKRNKKRRRPISYQCHELSPVYVRGLGPNMCYLLL